MVRFVLPLFIFLFLMSCSPIETVEGLGKYSTARSYPVPAQGRGGSLHDRSQHENYNAFISSSEGSDTHNLCGEFHLADNESVRDWIKEFTTGKSKERMQRFFERSNRYVAFMASILRQHGVPEILAYVPLIESGFIFNAESPKKARGYWQFTQETAAEKIYNLPMNKYMDARQDPELSTRAAAKHLNMLCRTFESWPLALAAYNAGQGTIGHFIVNNASRNFWHLAKRNDFPKETKHYVPQIMAVMKIAQAPYDYYDNLKPYPPIEYRLIKVSKRSYFSDISEQYVLPFEELLALNPMFKTDFIPGTGNSAYIRIPTNLTH